MSGPRDTQAIGTTDAGDTVIKSTPVEADYGRFATYDQRGTPITDKRMQVAMATQLLEDCERYRQAYEMEWLTLYSQYHGNTSITGKADWQSKVHAPFSKRDVDTIAARIVSIVLSEEDWWDVQPYNSNQDVLKDICRTTVNDELERARWREPLETSLKDSLICGNGPMKISYERMLMPRMAPDYQPGPLVTTLGRTTQLPGKFKMKRGLRAVSAMKMAPIVPTDFWLDPSGQNRFVIHRSKRHLTDLWKLTKPQIDPITGDEILPAIYDADEVSKIRPGSRDRKLDQFASTIRRERYLATEDMTVDVYEIWGDIPDPSTGVVMYPNSFMTFVDKQWLIRQPEANPFWHQRIPFIDFRSMLNPHQIYGYGFLMQGSLVQFEIDRVLQMISDKMACSFPMAEADMAAAKNSEDFGGSHLKIDPMRIFKKKGERPIFNVIQLTQGPTMQDAQTYEIFERVYEMVTNVNEWSTGTSESQTRKTAKEAEIKVAASQSAFSSIGQYIEEHSLAPLVSMVWELAIQFEANLTTPSILEALKDNQAALAMLQAFQGMQPEERFAKMNFDGNFRVDGVTRQVTKQQRLDRLVNFIKLVGQQPAMAALLDLRTLLQSAIVDFDQPSNIVLPPKDAVLQMAEQAGLARLQQMLNPQPPPGQGPPGQGGPPGPGGPQGPQQGQPGMNPFNQQEQAAASAQGAGGQPQ